MAPQPIHESIIDVNGTLSHRFCVGFATYRKAGKKHGLPALLHPVTEQLAIGTCDHLDLGLIQEVMEFAGENDHSAITSQKGRAKGKHSTPVYFWQMFYLTFSGANAAMFKLKFSEHIVTDF